MTTGRRIASITIAAALGLGLAVAPAQAAGRYEIVGTFPVNSPSDPYYGYFTQPNPEANWNRACARGVNGSDSRVRVGTRIPIVNGNNTRIGSGRITGARWEEDSGRVGQCVYEFVALNLPRSNFYCPVLFGEALAAARPSEANSRGTIYYEEYVGYFGPNWPGPDPAASIPGTASDPSNCYTG